MMTGIVKIVSDGQTGADRAALDWAIKNGIQHGGWCPKGRGAEDGPIDARYQLRETPSINSYQRTEWNVRDSDGTVIFSVEKRLTGGSKKTADLAKKHKKPLLHLRENEEDGAMELLCSFIYDNGIRVLNIAGPRASEEPTVAQFVKSSLNAVLKTLLIYVVDSPGGQKLFNLCLRDIPERFNKFLLRVFDDHQAAFETFRATVIRPALIIATFVKNGKAGSITDGLHLLTECKRLSPALKIVLCSVCCRDREMAESAVPLDGFWSKRVSARGYSADKALVALFKKLFPA
jgi:hypothetical protein